MEKLPDDINELLKEIDKKEYPPDEEYLQFKAQIDGYIELRDRIAKDMKYFPADEQAMKRLQLSNLENQIEKGKKSLKTFYESCQRVERENEKSELRQKHLDDAFERAEEASEKLYIIIKHTKPHLFEEFHQISVDCLTPEELNEFLERIAHLEATQLEDILAGK